MMNIPDHFYNLENLLKGQCITYLFIRYLSIKTKRKICIGFESHFCSLKFHFIILLFLILSKWMQHDGWETKRLQPNPDTTLSRWCPFENLCCPWLFPSRHSESWETVSPGNTNEQQSEITWPWCHRWRAVPFWVELFYTTKGTLEANSPAVLQHGASVRAGGQWNTSCFVSSLLSALFQGQPQKDTAPCWWEFS